MTIIYSIIAVVFVICLIITPIVIKFSKKFNLVDIPKDERRVHSKPMPRVGGIAIVISMLLGLGIYYIITRNIPSIALNKKFLGYLLGGIVIFAMGLIDDIVNLKARYKFLFQLAAAFIVYLFGIRISGIKIPFIYTDIINFGWLDLPITLLWIIGITNAINLIDGLDGLAAGISAISATTDKNFIEDPGLHRTLLGDGLATALAGLFGGPANTTYGENTGVLELSKVYDPKVVRLAAVYAIVVSFIPKLADVIGTMPTAIIGGISFVLYGMISAIGVRNVVENKVDFTKSRNLIVAAVILVSGLGFSNGITFTVAGTSVTLTSLAIAALLGILLNAILPGNDYNFGENHQGDINRGVSFNNKIEAS